MKGARLPFHAIGAFGAFGTLIAIAAVVAIVAAPAAAVVAGPAPVRPSYRPPVDAPVQDPFRAPPEPWLAGNRGIEYSTMPGQAVRAVGPGVVTFAGPVAGALYVTIRHPDGLRSTYGHLAAVRVGVDDRVEVGTVVAVAGDRLHLGVRRGDAYLDPASLWGRPVGGGGARLVPDRQGSGPRSPRLGPGGPAGSTTASTGAALVASVVQETIDLLVRAPWASRGTVATLGDRSASARADPNSARNHPTVVGAVRCSAARIRVSSNRWEERREHDRACRVHEATARRGRALRPPDPSLEPQDEALHLR